MNLLGNSTPKQSSGKSSTVVQHSFVTSRNLKCITALIQSGIFVTSDIQGIDLGINSFSDWCASADGGVRARSVLCSYASVCIETDTMIIIKANMIVAHVLCMFLRCLIFVYMICFGLQIHNLFRCIYSPCMAGFIGQEIDTFIRSSLVHAYSTFLVVTFSFIHLFLSKEHYHSYYYLSERDFD